MRLANSTRTGSLLHEECVYFRQMPYYARVVSRDHEAGAHASTVTLYS